MNEPANNGFSGRRSAPPLKPNVSETRKSPASLDTVVSLRILIVYPSGGCMQTRIQKWGNSLALRIPRSFAAELQVEEGSVVDVSVENGSLRVRAVRARRYFLRELLKGVSKRNLHSEVETGAAIGRESW